MSGLEFGLGRFGDLRLEKGGRACTQHWLIDQGHASAGWVGRGRGRCSLRAFFAMKR
jgi:hypothetical protein